MFSVNYFCRFRQLFLPVHPLFLTALLCPHADGGELPGQRRRLAYRVSTCSIVFPACGPWMIGTCATEPSDSMRKPT